jgi:hypothetical protein
MNKKARSEYDAKHPVIKKEQRDDGENNAQQKDGSMLAKLCSIFNKLNNTKK